MSNIKIYGLLENATTDNKLAQTSQIYDENLQKFQSEINSQVILQSEKGKADGVATLDSSGKIPTEQIPGMFDDVVEFENFAAFPETGETGKIYVALDTNISYRWSGSTYIKVGSPLELGETSTTAYAGDKGKATTDKVNSHVSNTSNPHSVTKAQVGLGNVDNTSDSNKPVSTAQQEAINNAKTEVTDTVGNYTINGKKINTNPSLVKADVGLGNVDNTSDANKPISTATQNALNAKVDKVDGKQLSTEDYTTEEKNKLSGIADNANNYTHPAGNAPSKTEGLYKFSTDGNSHIATATSVTKSDITALGIPAQDTTYTEATTSKSGLMSSGDKTKVDKILTSGEGTKFLSDNGTYKEIDISSNSILDISKYVNFETSTITDVEGLKLAMTNLTNNGTYTYVLYLDMLWTITYSGLILPNGAISFNIIQSEVDKMCFTRTYTLFLNFDNQQAALADSSPFMFRQDGSGNKVLTDDGKYKEISGFSSVYVLPKDQVLKGTLSDEEYNKLVNAIHDNMIIVVFYNSNEGYVATTTFTNEYQTLLSMYKMEYSSVKSINISIPPASPHKMTIETVDLIFNAQYISSGTRTWIPLSKKVSIIEPKTQSEYDSLPTKDANTLYLIKEG